MGHPILDMYTSPRMLGTFFSLAVMSYVDFTDADNVWWLTRLYVLFNVGIFLTNGLIYKLIGEGPNEIKEFTVVPPPGPFGMENPEGPTTYESTREYDQDQLFAQVKQSFITLTITCLIFYKMEAPRILFLQMVMAPLMLSVSPLFKIYVLGKDASGELKRPFKPPAGMMDNLKDAMKSAQMGKMNDRDAARMKKKEEKRDAKKELAKRNKR